MWYIFPQVGGLGASLMSQRYAIGNIEEGEEFLAHPVLGANYCRIVETVWHQVVERGVSISGLFGSPDDSKLVSSLTLFIGVARRLDPQPSWIADFIIHADEILQAAYLQGLARCTTTETFLAG
jgi:uncharacterized protein (DUF1810 family)